MKCYNCGCELSEKSFCTRCRADVGLYKRIMYTSNLYYNEGLDKALVRDLSGAVVSLRQSLKFNKENIEARNLLGLVYYEMGEVVAALSEWVISKNLREDKNLADDYINDLQADPGRLETINNTVKKYNLALAYCYNDSKDLAVIQLKKVLSLNPRFLQAHQLLALLYIDAQEWDKARKELNKCLKIDANNTMTLLYLREVDLQLATTQEEAGAKKKKKKKNDVVTYQSGNETIIQPVNMNESVQGNTFVNIIIGVLIGLAVALFLITPARIQNAQSESTAALKEVSENLDQKTSEVADLTTRIDMLESENTNLKEQLESFIGSDGQFQIVEGLLATANAYLNNPEDYRTIADSLYSVDRTYVSEQASDAYRALYSKLMELVGSQVAASLYESGRTAINQGDYSTAIDELEKAWYFDETNSDVLYQLAQAYRLSDNMEKAKETYQRVIELFPDSSNALSAQEHLNGGNEDAAEGAGEADGE